MKKSLFDPKTLASELRTTIAGLDTTPRSEETGIVHRLGDGVVWATGLWNVSFHEIVYIDTDDGETATGFALSLLEDEVGIVLLDSDQGVRAGATVRRGMESLSVPVGPELLGRVVDPLGRPLDGKAPAATKMKSPVERPAPSIIDRKGVHEPVLTGITAIDAMIPIGRGQRELIIGDRQIGKTAIAIDTMINQARIGSDMVSIYTAIGQKQSTISRLVERLRKEGVLDSAIIVATSASDPAAMQYIAPYAACTMGEWFRDNARHALVTYDDLTKHAIAYRQLSLLLRRPPGREAFPGDVFYLHSRLLERAAKLSDDKGAGSLTALPIIETQAGDVSAYIPTNVISITDGQIYLESDVFFQGIRPAISVGLSVSRVGSAAQPSIIKDSSKSLRVGLAQYREIAAFAQFGSDLDSETVKQLKRGQLLTELLKQPQYSPFATWQQVTILTLANNGVFDDVPIEKVALLREALLEEISAHHHPIIDSLRSSKEVDDTLLKSLRTVAEHVAQRFATAKQPAEETDE